MTQLPNLSGDAESLPVRLAEGFAERLAPNFDLHQLESQPASTFGLFPDGRIAYINPAWVRFALENGAQLPDEKHAWMGQRYLDVIAPPLKPFYANLLALAPAAGAAMHPVTHVYECSSAIIFRQFAMKVYGLANGTGYVVINTLVASRPHDGSTRVPHVPDGALYESPDGIIVQCAHCRLVRRTDGTGWDWVPAWVEQAPKEASHGVCAVCLEYYFPGD